jgi:hypothetical protein
MSNFVPPGPLKVPVLLTAFKRYDSAFRVMQAIRQAKPPRLYLAVDGPRNEEERIRTDKVRTLVELVDWPCEVHTLFRDVNKGTKHGMAENFDWFFSHEPEGIVLEDDIEPAQSFFWFAQEMLEKYRDDKRIWAIVGNNLDHEVSSDMASSYWAMAHGYGAYWGWAGWRRSWECTDLEMKDWPTVRDSGFLDEFFLSKGERSEAYDIFEYTWNGRIAGAWDYQFDFARIKAGALIVIPEMNLCRNLGFGMDATHSVNAKDPRNKDHLHELVWPIQHPEQLIEDKDRALEYFNAYVRTPIFQRLKNNVKGWLPGAVEKRVTPIISKIQKGIGLK